MPSYNDDLISLAENSPGIPVSPVTISSMSRCDVPRQDSFSGLASLMKAKKPYKPIASPSSRPSPSASSTSLQFASRVGSGSGILSPLAQPFRVGGSVAAYLQSQALTPPAIDTTPVAGYNEQDMQRLESMLLQLEEITVSDDGDNDTTAKHPHDTIEALLPAFELPTAPSDYMGPLAPPTPAPSTRPAPPEEPIVRISMHVWDAMGRDLQALKNDKEALETKIVHLEKQVAAPVDDYKSEIETQIGKLQYQNDCNRTQKATMARALSEKDIQIKQLQLELGGAMERLEAARTAARDHAEVVNQRDYLQASLTSDRVGNSKLLSDLADVKDREIKKLAQGVEHLQETLKQAAFDDNNEHKALAQKRLEQLSQCEKLLRSAEDRYGAEHLKVGELEVHIEDLQRRLNQVGDLQGQLSEKSSTCDRLRTKLKTLERILDDYKNRLTRVSNGGDSLRGAAHLVKPDKGSKLSSLVMGCAECYAKNISCDNKARCRHCTENNETCARWRCSLRHILGDCPDMPCTFPHEADGWLLATEPRPQW